MGRVGGSGQSVLDGCEGPWCLRQGHPAMSNLAQPSAVTAVTPARTPCKPGTRRTAPREACKRALCRPGDQRYTANRRRVWPVGSPKAAAASRNHLRTTDSTMTVKRPQSALRNIQWSLKCQRLHSRTEWPLEPGGWVAAALALPALGTKQPGPNEQAIGKAAYLLEEADLPRLQALCT